MGNVPHGGLFACGMAHMRDGPPEGTARLTLGSHCIPLFTDEPFWKFF